MKLDRKGERGESFHLLCLSVVTVSNQLVIKQKTKFGRKWNDEIILELLKQEIDVKIKDQREAVKLLVISFICHHHINAGLVILFALSSHEHYSKHKRKECIELSVQGKVFSPGTKQI